MAKVRTKCRRNIAENYNRLSRVHERYRRQTTDRQTDRRQTDGRQHIANVNVSSRSLKINTRHLDPSTVFAGLTTVTDRSTDHATRSATVGRVTYVILWCGLIIRQ